MVELLRKGDKTLQQVLKCKTKWGQASISASEVSIQVACPFKEREVAGHPVLHAANPPPVVFVY